MGFLKSLFTWWDGPTFGTWLETKRLGTEMGRDDTGNVYYQTKDSRRRWVIYAGDNEATRVPPEWLIWLHRTVDQVPDDQPPVNAWEQPWVPNMTGSANAHSPAGALANGGTRARATGDYQAWKPD